MKKTYTEFNELSIKNFISSYENELAVNFLCADENFRPFAQGLTELLQKVNFQGAPSNVQEKTEFLIKKLREIDSTLTSKTVAAWFDGKYRPKIEPHSRLKMYEICFALNLNFDQVDWFFHHVYFDRTFNCHSINEVVYFFAFLRNLSYAEANEIIAEIESAPIDNTDSDDEIYTQFIRNRVASIETVDELKSFLIQNKKSFAAWNKTALNRIKMLREEIVGNEAVAKPIIRKLRKTLEQCRAETIEFSEDEINKCGLLVRYICLRARSDKNFGGKYNAVELEESIENANVFSNDFVLKNFLGMLTGINKRINVPYIVKNNFPSKKILSEVLNDGKSNVSKSYDAIRKMLILFHFHNFWYKVKLHDLENLEPEEIENLPEIYRNETDTLLEQCGYEPLYAGNPFDWIFLCSANSQDSDSPENYAYPLDFFAELILNLTDEL